MDERELTEKARGMRALLEGLRRISELGDQEEFLRQAAPELAADVYLDRLEVLVRKIRGRFGSVLSDADIRLAAEIEACRMRETRGAE